MPSIYPMLKDEFRLDFGQIGLITLAFQLTASLLQPMIGLYTDRSRLPYSLAVGMGSTLAGLLLLAYRHELSRCCCSPRRWSARARRSSIPNPRAWRGMASGGRHGLAQSLFQVGGNVGSALGPLARGLHRAAARAEEHRLVLGRWRSAAWSSWAGSAPGTAAHRRDRAHRGARRR